MIKFFFKNKSSSRIKDFYFLFLTLFFKTIINFLLLFYVAKITSVSEFGVFTLSFVVMTINILLIDYGYNLHSLVLDYKNKLEVSKNISSFISGKFLISIFLLIVLISIIFFIPIDQSLKKVLLILSISAVPNSFGNFYFSLFKGNNNYYKESIGFLLQGLLLTFLLVINHFCYSQDIVTISIIILITKIIFFCYSWYQFKRMFNIKFRFSVEQGLLSFVKSYNYGIHLIFGTLIIYIETLFLSNFSDMKTVGYYQAGLRLIMAASLFGAIITDGFVPQISKNKYNRKLVTKKMINLFNILLVFYFLLSLTLSFNFNTIIDLLYTKNFLIIENYIFYIILIIICRAIGIVPGVILTSLGLQKIRARAAIFSFLLSVVLNLFLVPLFGIEGAFISFLFTNILLTCIYFYFSFKEINFVKEVPLKIIFFLLLYWLAQVLILKDNFSHLCISSLICMIIMLITYKTLHYSDVTN
jgi:O-antigen/teichoic acid export membrane protein